MKSRRMVGTKKVSSSVATFLFNRKVILTVLALVSLVRLNFVIVNMVKSLSSKSRCWKYFGIPDLSTIKTWGAKHAV